MNLHKRITQLEQSAIDAIPPEPVPCLFLPSDEAEISRRTEAGLQTIVFTTVDARLDSIGAVDEI